MQIEDCRQSSIYKVMPNKLILLANMHINQLLNQRSDLLDLMQGGSVVWVQATQLLLMKLHEIVAKSRDHKILKRDRFKNQQQLQQRSVIGAFALIMKMQYASNWRLLSVSSFASFLLHYKSKQNTADVHQNLILQFVVEEDRRQSNKHEITDKSQLT